MSGRPQWSIRGAFKHSQAWTMMQFPAMVTIQHMWQYQISRVLSSAYLVVRKRGTCTLLWHLLECCILNPGLPPHMWLVVMVSYSASPHGLIIWSLYSVNQFFHRSMHFNLMDYPVQYIFLENLFNLRTVRSQMNCSFRSFTRAYFSSDEINIFLEY